MTQYNLQVEGTIESMLDELFCLTNDKVQSIGPKTKLKFKADSEIIFDFEKERVHHKFSNVQTH